MVVGGWLVANGIWLMVIGKWWKVEPGGWMREIWVLETRQFECPTKGGCIENKCFTSNLFSIQFSLTFHFKENHSLPLRQTGN